MRNPSGWLVIVVALLFAPLSFGTALAGKGAEGIWRLSNGKITVQVYTCGGANLCATIVGLSQPLNKAGKPKTDHENPNRALRNRPVIGIQVVNGMAPAGVNRWKGRIYNADDGGTYRAQMRLAGDTMLIDGCWGPFCKKNRFIRVK